MNINTSIINTVKKIKMIQVCRKELEPIRKKKKINWKDGVQAAVTQVWLKLKVVEMSQNI